MIRRTVEYIIICDAERAIGYVVCDRDAHAFNAITAAECATAAEREGWVRVSKRLWVCPKCAKNIVRIDEQ